MSNKLHERLIRDAATVLTEVKELNRRVGIQNSRVLKNEEAMAKLQTNDEERKQIGRHIEKDRSQKMRGAE